MTQPKYTMILIKPAQSTQDYANIANALRELAKEIDSGDYHNKLMRLCTTDGVVVGTVNNL